MPPACVPAGTQARSACSPVFEERVDATFGDAKERKRRRRELGWPVLDLGCCRVRMQGYLKDRLFSKFLEQDTLVLGHQASILALLKRGDELRQVGPRLPTA